MSKPVLTGRMQMCALTSGGCSSGVWRAAHASRPYSQCFSSSANTSVCRQQPSSLKAGSFPFASLNARAIKLSPYASRQFDTARSVTEETTEQNSFKVEEEVADQTVSARDETADRRSLDLTNSVEAFTVSDETLQEDTHEDVNQLTDIIVNFRKKFDSVEDKSKLFIYGGSATVALWVSATLIEVIDSVPLLPRFMELIGFGYTVWFVYRYVLFKGNRDELLVLIKEFKQKITG